MSSIINWQEFIDQDPSPDRFIITFEGMPASGKSTCVGAIRKEFPTLLYLTEQFDYTTKEDKETFKRLDLELGSFKVKKAEVYQRIYLEAELRRQQVVLQSTSPDDVIVLDRGVEDTVFATEIYGEQGQLNLNYFIENYYPKIARTRATLTILLDASLETLQKRLIARQRETGVYEDRMDYYALFYQYYRPWYENNLKNVFIVATDHCSIDLIANQAVDIIRSFLHEKYR